MNSNYFGSTKAIRRKSPVYDKLKKRGSLTVAYMENDENLTNLKNKRGASFTAEKHEVLGEIEEIIPKKPVLKITKSSSFTFENIESYNKSRIAKDHLKVPDEEDEDDDFFDAKTHLDSKDPRQLGINYELPSDPVARRRWIKGLARMRATLGRTDKIDPFNFFEVEHEPCHFLKVRVLKGKNISRGLIKDMLDTPDPYVVVHIRASPDGKKRTRHVDNDTNPEWNEELHYYLASKSEVQIIAEISLMDSNITVDEIYGTVEFNVSNLPLDQPVKKSFLFNETSEVEIEFLKEITCGQDLRPSLALCTEEKEYRSQRKKVVKQGMQKLMEERNDGGGGPRVLRETPTIAVIGSGGGFRAMTGYAGAMKALHDSGILDCVTYVSGLSGSSWYLATLYANEDFPKNGTEQTKKEIRKNIESSPFWLLKPECLMLYSYRLRTKMKLGQPVTFTDFFGMLIGQTLLGAKKMQTAKLSDFREKIKDGSAPMPVMTCLHVRPKTSAMTFHDWVEFTPYEIGMAKYATFMNTMYFGSKFFMGVLAKEHEESPLHFLMGVWGSAFSILFNRLVDKNKGACSKNEDIREEMENELSCEISHNNNKHDDESDSEIDDDDDEFHDAKEEVAPRARQQSKGILGSIWSMSGLAKEDSIDEITERNDEEPKRKNRGFLNSIVSNVFGTNIMESREYRAGKVLNYMRGLSLAKTYPLSPFTPLCETDTIAEPNEFQKLHEPIEVKRKKVHLVDAGLTFNSPYPPMLRPQRAVDLIISFDFSKRKCDHAEPFKEILLAEKWAKIHHLPFPKIDRTVYEREGVKECYVFKDEKNDKAPIIIHFTLCNEQFRNFSAPGVPRKPNDTRGDFKIFDDAKSPYSTFNFQYSNSAFDRLHDLIEFNTLLHVETIVREIQTCVQFRRRSHARGSITLNDIRNSRHLSAKNRQSLESKLISKEKDEQFFSL